MANYRDGTRVHTGRVSRWHEAEGWGLLEAPDIEGAVWAHFSLIDPASAGTRPGGFRTLRRGESVSFAAERAEQDGYHWRATWIEGHGATSR
ncbi:cold-shock protein [Nocardia sp. NPDC127579]|uniref:cold-shock protein n=1 Tax=Nocardia sp. NPDC127579 TaxID=3345402 RepID=UPI003632C572